MENVIELNFYGPFKFIKGSNYLYDSELINKEGIYIWTIKDEKNNINYVHYIGETTILGKRQKEHLIQITGLNYRIIDSDLAKEGIEKIVWNGMWRDKSSTAVTNLIENYNSISSKVVSYIELKNIYFAPTNSTSDIRRHIEGCLGWNCRSKFPDLQCFYPADNFIRKSKNSLNKKLIVNLPESINGIDREIDI